MHMSTDRILTTHAGSLPRGAALAEMLVAAEQGEAVDAAALAAVLARTRTPPYYGAETLTNPAGFAGIDGIFRFQSDGLSQRGLAVLEVRPDGVKVISPAPVSFDPPTN